MFSFKKNLQGFVRELQQTNRIMQTKEHSKEVRKKVLKKYKAELGYKTISQNTNNRLTTLVKYVKKKNRLQQTVQKI